MGGWQVSETYFITNRKCLTVGHFVTSCCFSSVIGGLLSAHLLAPRAGVTVEEGWPCQGPLLRLAVDVAERLLPGWYPDLS